jgi:hypothetical protein
MLGQQQQILDQADHAIRLVVDDLQEAQGDLPVFHRAVKQRFSVLFTEVSGCAAHGTHWPQTPAACSQSVLLRDVLQTP